MKLKEYCENIVSQLQDIRRDRKDFIGSWVDVEVTVDSKGDIAVIDCPNNSKLKFQLSLDK